MSYSTEQQRDIEKAAVNTTVKDWGKKGLDKNGAAKQGYHILKDSRVVRVSDLLGKTTPKPSTKPANTETLPYDIEEEAAKHDMRNLVGIGTDENGNAKEHFYKLKDGKVISLKRLHEAYINNIDVKE